MTGPELRWPRPAGNLTLALPTRSLLDAVLTWRNDPAVTRWLLRTDFDAARFRQSWFDSVDDPWTHQAIATYAGHAVGTVGLDVCDGMGQDSGSVWRRSEGLVYFMVDPAYAGRGIATTMAAMIEVAFGELGLRRVTAGCFVDNAASWRVMEKLGMRREQHGVRDSWHAELGWVDGFTYAILAEEWRGTGRH